MSTTTTTMKHYCYNHQLLLAILFTTAEYYKHGYYRHEQPRGEIYTFQHSTTHDQQQTTYNNKKQKKTNSK